MIISIWTTTWKCADIYYNEWRRFVENKPEVSDELFEALNIIERFTVNAAIISKTKNKNKY